ncbi:hypothetical protein D3C84_1018390 [compost metagenome]
MSRRRVPTNDSESVVNARASTGNNSERGACSAKPAAVAMIRPQVGTSGAIPMPKKLRTDSVVMARGMTMAICVSRVPMAFGRT